MRKSGKAAKTSQTALPKKTGEYFAQTAHQKWQSRNITVTTSSGVIEHTYLLNKDMDACLFRPPILKITAPLLKSISEQLDLISLDLFFHIIGDL